MRDTSDSHETATVAPDAVPATALSERLAEGAVVGGRYEIRGELGAGGSAVVYRAYDRLIKHEIALKVMRRERLTANALIRLRREAAAARDVVHPNLVRVFDLGTADELTFLAMEVVEGETLRERLRRGPLPVEESIRIATELLGGLAALHGAGLLHRDVKPGNVLLAADGTVRLADLGLVRKWESDETRATESEAVIGTFEYLSPEQAMGEELDVRSDLYSLGALLFETLAGRLPHAGKSSLGTLLANLRQPVPDLRSLRQEVPRWLARVVHRLLERERVDRYASAEAVLADLGRRRVSLRTGRRWRSGSRWLALALAVAAVAAARSGYRAWLDRPVFDRVVGEGERNVRAVDTRGRVLWRKEDAVANRNFAVVRFGDGRRPLLAALLVASGNRPTAERQTLHLLDPLSGESVETIEMPNRADVFRGMSDNYGRELLTMDLNDDGADEVLVTFTHTPFWPSFTVLCEPRVGSCRSLLYASGHHRPLAAVDLDGDGRKEVIVAGINNRMGFYTGLAALRLRPWLGEERPSSASGSPATTPDETWVYQDEGTLYWYALLPSGLAFPAAQSLRVDSAARSIVVSFRDTSELRVGFDGFVLGEPSELASAERMAVRQQAYSVLREFHRLLGAGEVAAAEAAAESANLAATRAGDPRLADWARRMLHRARVRGGRFDAAEALATELVDASDAPSDTAWEIARNFHLAGAVDRAARWYEQALLRDTEPEKGRFPDEYLEGLALALAESGRWSELDATLERWARSFNRLQAPARMLLAWSRWRQGRFTATREELEQLDGVLLNENSPDFHRYLGLELARGEGEAPAEMLSRIESEFRRSSETHVLLRSLQSMVLEDLGRHDEARRRAHQALDDARRELDLNIYSRGHLALLEARAARLDA